MNPFLNDCPLDKMNILWDILNVLVKENICFSLPYDMVPFLYETNKLLLNNFFKNSFDAIGIVLYSL